MVSVLSDVIGQNFHTIAAIVKASNADSPIEASRIRDTAATAALESPLSNA